MLFYELKTHISRYYLFRTSVENALRTVQVIKKQSTPTHTQIDVNRKIIS
jgi:hypothetical protein